MSDEKYQRGLKKLAEVDGGAGQAVIDALKDVCPDLARYTIEFPFGDIYSRPGLDLRAREIAVVAALTVLGTLIKEVIMQMAVYGGFPCALNAMMVAKEVFQGK
jgi:4-carboxymuconolactone decarboxylase